MHLLRQLSNASEEIKHLLTARNALAGPPNRHRELEV
jgi:hypothetical protein